MPTEARGNYLPEPHYLRETKTYHSQPLESTRHAGNYFVPISIRPIFVAEVNMSNYLTTDGLKTIFSTSGGPTEARGICHMVNPALILSKLLITYRAVESVVSVSVSTLIF